MNLTGNEADFPEAGKVLDNFEHDLEDAKILVAEDNVINFLIIKNLLELCKVKVTAANNGKECIELYAENDYDLILMDLNMPVMSGFEAATYIRTKMPSNKNSIPIIALTGSTLPEDQNKMLAAGMNDAYIPKPFTTKDFYQKIAFYIKKDGVRSLDEEIKTIVEKEEKYNFRYLLQVVPASSPALRQLTEKFLEKTPLDIDHLRELIENRDFIKAGSFAHKIKPTFGYFGISEIVHKLNNIELNSETGNSYQYFKKEIEDVFNIWNGLKEELEFDIKNMIFQK